MTSIAIVSAPALLDEEPSQGIKRVQGITRFAFCSLLALSVPVTTIMLASLRAAQAAEAAAEAANEKGVALAQKGFALWNAPKYEEALPFCQTALELYPTYFTGNSRMGDYYNYVKGDKAAKEYRYSEADAYYKQALQYYGEAEHKCPAKMRHPPWDVQHLLVSAEVMQGRSQRTRKV